MYSRQEASQLKQEFWTSFGQYMAPVLSAEGERINWINYKTGEKSIQFKMHADNKGASIGIELSHRDTEIQQIYFEHLLQLKKIFEDTVREEWTWALHATGENEQSISRIYQDLPGVSIFKKSSWPDLISFFKPRMIALDEFWSSVKYGFESLR